MVLGDNLAEALPAPCSHSSPKNIKSPSDTTIYAPALNLRTLNESLPSTDQVVDKITNFVEQVRMIYDMICCPLRQMCLYAEPHCEISVIWWSRKCHTQGLYHKRKPVRGILTK